MGAYLSTPVTEKDTSYGQNEYMKVGVTAMQGWRTEMEDAHALKLDVDTNTHLFGIFDGHGGKEVAIFAARHLHDQILRNQHYVTGDFTKCLQESFVQMDRMMLTKEGINELLEIANGKPEEPAPARKQPDSPIAASAQPGNRRKQGDPPSRLPRALSIAGIDSDVSDSIGGGIPSRSSMKAPVIITEEGPTAGCTAVAALVHGKKVYVANAGDSRCVMCRNGEAYPLSYDHKPTDDAEEGRIKSAGGQVHDGRVNGCLNLSRALGDMEFKQRTDLGPEAQMITAHPDVIAVELGAGDEFMVLACDGIWDVLTSQHCVDFVRERLQKGESPSAITEAMCDECLARDSNTSGIGCDNMSAMVVVFESALIDLPVEEETPSKRRK